jgi:hypothetical protein
MADQKVPSSMGSGNFKSPLDAGSALRQFGVPKLTRRCRRLCLAQQDEKSGFSCFCQQCTEGCGYILAEQRPGVREAPAALLVPGSVVSSFFVSESFKLTEVHHV